MTPRFREIDNALATGRLVVVCWEPECRKHRMPHWDEDAWVEHERSGDPHQYTHGICDVHEALYRREIDLYFGKKEAAVAA